MNRLNFSVLEIIAESENHSLRDDGFVPDVTEHTKKIYRDCMGSEEGMEEYIAAYDSKNPRGRCLPLSSGNDRVWVIFYEHADPTAEVWIRAHEETHVLHAIGQIHLLQQKLAQRGLDIDLGKYADLDTCSKNQKELVAYIGSLYRLEKKGRDISQMSVEQSATEVQPAIRLYQQAIRDG